MLGVATVAGLLAGWLFYWGSEKAMSQATPWAARRLPAPENAWFWLRLGVILVSAATFGYLWERFGPSWETLRLAVIYGFLMVISLIDLKSRRVPNNLVYPAIVLAVLYQAFVSPRVLAEAAIGGGMVFAIFYLTAWLRPGELGGGDIKLAALIGIGLGFPLVLWALLVGAGVGAAVAIFLIFGLRWNEKSGIPYAPFLCLGAWVALVYNPLPIFLP